MRGYNWLMGLVLLGVGLPGIAAGAEPDPEAVRRLMEKYEREAAEEAAKKAPAPKPRPKPAPAPKPEPAPKPKPQPAPTVNYDHEAWKSADRCGTAACFEAYLEEYPKGRYARMAKARLKPASEPPTPEPVTPVVTERPAPLPRPVQTLLADRYRDSGDGTVTDVRTGLQWMRCSLGQTWRGETCVGEAEKYTWQAAIDAADTFNRQGGYIGYRDWRVPTAKELRTLIYCSSGQPKIWNDTAKPNPCEGSFTRPMLYQSAFPNAPDWYWSSSTVFGQLSAAWPVGFGNGGNYSLNKDYFYHTRLVRGGP